MMESILFELSVLGLDLHGWLTLIVVVVATLLMAFERLGPDLVMFCAIAVLVVAGVITPEQALVGFSRPETVTVGVLFVVAAAMEETGAIHRLSSLVFGKVHTQLGAMSRILFPTAMLSAFLNNTPIVTMFIPLVTGFARRLGVSPSKMLMPLSFAAMLGGTCTLIGTSTNLVVSGLMEQEGIGTLGMFELSAVGVPTAIAGLVFLMFLSGKVLPDRTDPLVSAQSQAKEFLVEMQLAEDSPMVGQTVQGANLRNLPGLFLVEIRRANGEVLRPVAREDELVGGDLLVFTGDKDSLPDLTNLPGLTATGEVPRPGKGIYEVVVSHHSGLVGRSVRAIEFRRRFGAAILAVHRAGERIEGKIGDIILRAGDTLMLVARPGFDRAWSNSEHFYLISEVSAEHQPRYRQVNVALFALALMVVLPAATDLSMTVSSMAALVLLIATQALSPRKARESVNWSVLLLIGSAFGLSTALVETGAADVVADALIGWTSAMGPRGLLMGVYLMGTFFSLFISNTAAAALVFPVAIVAAQADGLDPRPFAIALTMAASAAFATPIGYQTNLLVYGPGGYRYGDFARLGLPLHVICFLVAMLIIPMVWPLTVV